MPVRIDPLDPDGVVGSPLGGVCHDLSRGGLRIYTQHPVRTERVYVDFHSVDEVKGHAVYVRVLRATQDIEGAAMAGRFRTRE